MKLSFICILPEGEVIDTDYLSSILDQLWAEALELYHNEYLPVLTSEAQAIAVGLQNDAMDEDVYLGLIQNYLERDGWGTMEAPIEVCSQMIWEQGLEGKGKVQPKDSKEIGRIMNKMPGWKLYSGSKDGRKKVGIYGYQKCWVRENN